MSATGEAVELTKLGLQLSKTEYNSSSDINKVTIWDGTLKVGEEVFVAGSDVRTVSLGTCPGCGHVVVPKDGNKILAVAVDLALQGTSQPGTPRRHCCG